MTQIWKVGLGVVALAFAAGCAGPSEAKRDVEGAVAGIEESKEGLVVDVNKDYVAVQDVDNPNAPPMEFHRTGETDLLRNDQPFSWPELSEGTPVRVSFESEAGAEEATKIEILTGAEADEVRSKAGSSTGWSKPDGIGSTPGQSAPPPSDMPGQSAPPPYEGPGGSEDDSSY